MTQLPLESFKSLAKRFRRPNEKKASYAIDDIQNMARFYQSINQNGSSKKTGQYVITLMYAAAIIKMYRKLTNEIAELAGEAESKSEGEQN